MEKVKDKESLQELQNAPVGRLLWKYSLPAVVGMLVMSLFVKFKFRLPCEPGIIHNDAQ